MTYRFLSCFLFTLLPLLGACQGYDFTVNDKVVYRAPVLFSDFAVGDPALRQCLQQAIVDAAITRAEDLTSLNCSHAGIETLDGLATFDGLTALRLSSNRIRNLVELNRMTSLQTLYLDNNRVVDPVPLYSLPRLTQLDLSGNPGLQCPRQGKLAGKALLPDHCH